MKMRRVAWASRCDVSSRENNEFKLLVLLRLDSTRPATKLTSESEVGPTSVFAIPAWSLVQVAQ